MRDSRRPGRGLTLLELLLVVTILATVALSAVAAVGTADQQVRYEDTKSRLEMIRTAVVGQADVARPGRGQASGFVADVGRLPQSLSELVEQGTLAAYTLDPATGVGTGWRGPYLRTLPAASGSLEFHDGWGNLDPSRGPDDSPGPNYGWEVSGVSGGTLGVQSRGPDDQLGTADDYPSTLTSPLVTRADYLVDSSAWTVAVVIENVTGGTLDLTAGVRLELAFPDPAELEGVRTAASTEDTTVLLAPGAESDPIPFTFNVGWVPWGSRTLRLFKRDGAGTWTLADAAGSTQRLRVDLIPRTALPAEVLVPWRVQ